MNTHFELQNKLILAFSNMFIYYSDAKKRKSDAIAIKKSDAAAMQETKHIKMHAEGSELIKNILTKPFPSLTADNLKACIVYYGIENGTIKDPKKADLVQQLLHHTTRIVNTTLATPPILAAIPPSSLF